MTQTTSGYVLPFDRIDLDDLPRVGGKNASLGEMVRALKPVGVQVPDGFAITVEAYRDQIRGAGLEHEISRRLGALDVTDVGALSETAAWIRARVAGTRLSKPMADAIRGAYTDLSQRYGEDATDVAVRSSATAEDLPTASFAGQQETYLNVRGFEALDRAVRDCMASLFTDRAIVYRVQNGIAHAQVMLSVGVQKMVRSDLGAAGVIFTLDTESGFPGVVLVTGAWGLGEVVVQGRVNPDEFWVHKQTLRDGFRPIVRRELGDKAIRLVYADGGSRSVREERVPREMRSRAVLTDDDVLQLARWSLVIEDHYSRRAGHPTPMDIEWAKDGRSGALFVVQARPETVHGRAGTRLELFKMAGHGTILARGKSVGARVGVGRVRRIRATSELKDFQPGDVLVAEMTDPDWEPVLARASAVVTDQGGRTCHAAIVCREARIPCVVGTGNATSSLPEGADVTVSCAEGEVGRVYSGRVPFTREEIDPAGLPTPPVPLMMNVADPDQAFHLASIPASGVGLLRIEFLVSNWIGIHPMALVHPERVADDPTRTEIARRIGGASDPAGFFVDRMASGVAVIAAAFHPRPVIVRFSDFKTNEYAHLLGGAAFEPAEENPMIGFRGASRYYDDRYREGFALECRALRKVRDEMGLRNVKTMIPFCRTLEEGRRVVEEMRVNGLVRGKDGLEVWVMCEIPNNVILADGFSELFDGFSIGSNDLTQLTLGVDRDSEILAHLFQENDPGVKRMIEMVITTAHEKGRRVGICGQAPSDDPEFAAWLVSVGIDSMSLTPDSIANVARRLAVRA